MLFFACFLLFSGLNAAVWCLDMIVCVCADGLATPLCGPHTKQPSTSVRIPGVPRSVDSVVATPAQLALLSYNRQFTDTRLSISNK